MTQAMKGLVAEAKKNKFSTLSTIRPGVLTEDEVGSIWDGVSAFVEKHMAQQKGVNIPGLGTFTFSQKKLDVGNNKFLLIKRPVFLLSEKFAQTHGLSYTVHHVSGRIPVVQLNFSALSFDTVFDRDTVEACVKEVLNALQRSVAATKSVEFTFNGIGQLVIKDNRVKMIFFKEFIDSMDGTGRLIQALKNRPETSDSLLLDRAQNKQNNQQLHLPRIQGNLNLVPDSQSPVMPHIGLPKDGLVDNISVCAEQPNRQLSNVKQVISSDVKKSGITEKKSLPRSPLPVPSTAEVVVFNNGVISQSPSHNSPLCVISALPQSRLLSPLQIPSFPITPSKDLTSPSPDKLPSPPRPPKPVPLERERCEHTQSGQELCYLCHQRASKNIQVSFAKERQWQEQEEDKLLQQYQHLKDKNTMLDEQKQCLVKRKTNQDMAAFNLQVAAAIKEKKHARNTKFHSSYIFQNRPPTPPRFIKQDLYSHDLGEQVSGKKEVRSRRKAGDEFLDRLEQLHLAEDLAAQREQYRKEKSEQQGLYKRALSTQIKVRDSICSPSGTPYIRADKRLGPLNMPHPKIILPFSQSYIMKIQEGDGLNKRIKQVKGYQYCKTESSPPVFGQNDMNSERLKEKRQMAHELYKDQLATVEQRKREAILIQMEEQRQEEAMLRKTRDELLKDRAESYKRLRETRKKLEGDWFKAVDTKNDREHIENEHDRSAGMLLHAQCDKYCHCQQCKRRLANCGQSSIWRDSRYIPGSRLMV